MNSVSVPETYWDAASRIGFRLRSPAPAGFGGFRAQLSIELDDLKNRIRGLVDTIVFDSTNSPDVTKANITKCIDAVSDLLKRFDRGGDSYTLILRAGQWHIVPEYTLPTGSYSVITSPPTTQPAPGAPPSGGGPPAID